MQPEFIPAIGPALTVSNQSRIDELLNAFIADQDVKESSRQLYKRTMKQYFRWVNGKALDMASITWVDILAYKEHQLAAGLTSLSVGSYITSVRRFYEWAEANKYYPNVAKGVKSPKRKQQFKKQALTQLQTVELVAHARKCFLRDFAVITLLLRTGIRTIELIRASIQDIEFKGSKRVLQVHGKKGNASNIFPAFLDDILNRDLRILTGYTKSNGTDIVLWRKFEMA